MMKVLTGPRVILAALAVCFLAVVASSALVLFRTYEEYEAAKIREARTRARLAEVRDALAAKERYIKLLLDDDDFMEQIVRQKLGYVRPGEILIRFEQSNPARR